MKSNSLVFNCILLAGVCGCACPHNVEERLRALEKECGLVDEPVNTAVRSPARISEMPSLANLEPKIPFAEAVELAKMKDGKGYFAMATSYYYGDDVRANEDIAKYFFTQSAGTGNVNAEFALALLSEKEHERFDGARIYRNGRVNQPNLYQPNLLRRTRDGYQSLPASALLNRRSHLPFRDCLSGTSTLPPLTNAVEVAALRDKYALFLQKGIACASNEVARCDEWLWGNAEWFKRQNEAKAEKEARKKENEKNNLLAETLIPLDLWIASTNTASRGGLGGSCPQFRSRCPAASVRDQNSLARSTSSVADLEPKIPFAEAVELAKKKDGKGYFALAVSHYYGTDVRADEDISRYFFTQAAGAGDVNAEFVLTLLSEKDHAIFNGVRIRRNGQDNISSRPGLLNRNRDNRIDRNRYQSLQASTLLSGVQLHGEKRGSRKPLLAPLTNTVDVVALRDKYQSFVIKGIGCASNEVARCDEWLWGHAEWCKRKVAEMETLKMAMKNLKAKRKEEEEHLSNNTMLLEQLIPKDLWVATTNVSEKGADVSRGSLDRLRARREQRCAEKTARAEGKKTTEREGVARELERDEQRKQLQLIQEELKKARMERERSADR